MSTQIAETVLRIVLGMVPQLVIQHTAQNMNPLVIKISMISGNLIDQSSQAGDKGDIMGETISLQTAARCGSAKRKVFLEVQMLPRFIVLLRM